MPDFSQIDLVIFDCDGVLIDSELISANVLIDKLKRHDIFIDLNYVRKYFFGRSFPTVAQTIRRDFNIDLPADFEQRYRHRLLDQFETDLRASPGIEQVLSDLTCAKCVATSSSPERVSRSLAITGLDRYFGSDVFTASQVKYGKPAPDLFLFAASHMDVPADRVLVIEDSAPGLAAAEAADMLAGFYSGGSHLQDADHSGIDVALRLQTWQDFPSNLLKET